MSTSTFKSRVFSISTSILSSPTPPPPPLLQRSSTIQHPSATSANICALHRTYSNASRRKKKKTAAAAAAAAAASAKMTSTSLSTAPAPAAPEELSRLSRDGLVRKIRYLEKELRRAHAVASANGVVIPPFEKIPSPRRPPPPSPDSAAVDDSESKDKGNKTKNKKERKKDAPKRKPQPFNTRLVAFKIAYLGKNYGGFEFQASGNVESIEEVIWKALVRSCLIVPENPDRIDWLPHRYAKCGRTDKGVSAFGQVISIRVRSSKPMPRPEPTAEDARETEDGADDPDHNKQQTENPQREWDPIKDEVDYPRIMNRLLPPDVKVIAWCPTIPEDFDARFSCGERRYRYFFTQPAFSPLPRILETEELIVDKPHRNKKRHRSPSPDSATPRNRRAKSPVPEPIKRYKEGWLDVEAMREAASYFKGSHDFRNFCRIDGAKQLAEYTRELFEVTIEEVKEAGSSLPYVSVEAFTPKGVDMGDEPHPKVYSFNVYGNAFLWHQIRCMIGILFLVGQGLEKPTIVRDLLDVEKYPKKPQYTMAEEVPLVLWDCLFPKAGEGRKDALDWIYNSNCDLAGDHGAHGMYDHLWSVWRERKMDEILANRLLDMYSKQGDAGRKATARDAPDAQWARKQLARTYRLYEGGNNARIDGRFVPVARKQLQPSFSEVNDAFARKKGFKSSEEMRAGGGNWLAELRKRKADALAREHEAVGRAAAVAVGGTEEGASEPMVVDDWDAEIVGVAAAFAVGPRVEDEEEDSKVKERQELVVVDAPAGEGS
ncbi:tRNA pseudouridine(38/39) synthase [Zalerion maritima]|uniref:tRNA pseudouridine(38/39) synthase n=1 Tax=Zalerion maritima TaxID=339359 RepID=A0AAD5WVX1_9PEZI|nr:tRNA pseudouridine(38/39) synthase [Zalerion maritima]